MLSRRRRRVTGRDGARPRPGRHVRRAAVQAAPAVAVAAALVVAALAAGPRWPAAIAVVACVLVVALAGRRLLAARAADAAEERSLRGLLATLSDPPLEDEDEDLLVP